MDISINYDHSIEFLCTISAISGVALFAFWECHNQQYSTQSSPSIPSPLLSWGMGWGLGTGVQCWGEASDPLPGLEHLPPAQQILLGLSLLFSFVLLLLCPPHPFLLSQWCAVPKKWKTGPNISKGWLWVWHTRFIYITPHEKRTGYFLHLFYRATILKIYNPLSELLGTPSTQSPDFHVYTDLVLPTTSVNDLTTSPLFLIFLFFTSIHFCFFLPHSCLSIYRISHLNLTHPKAHQPICLKLIHLNLCVPPHAFAHLPCLIKSHYSVFLFWSSMEQIHTSFSHGSPIPCYLKILISKLEQWPFTPHWIIPALL